ncbi:MAG: PAS domain S-box protein [Spirochaetaceae bacterium]|nr:MAG: PAS domain S-box protein [Spirochaetaceae bacterium]
MSRNDRQGLQKRLDQVEALVEQERSKLKQLFEHIPLPAYHVSLDGLIVDVNSTALNFLKVADKQDLIGKPLLTAIYAPASRAKAKKVLEKWKHTGSLRNEELQVQTADGEVRDVLLNVDTILDQEGKPQYSISVHLDITERKRVEQALRREEERSRMYLDMAGVMLLALDREGHVVLANPKACSVLEGEEADILGKDWFVSFIPEQVRTEVERVFQQLMRGAMEPAEYFENQIVSLKGNIRWIAWHNTLVKSRDGAILGTFSSGEDITERRHTAQALRESEERFRELTDTLPQVVFEVDIRATITYANRRAFELFGYVEADLKRGLNTLEMIAAQDRERAGANIRRVLQGEKSESTEYLAQRKDGSTFPVMIHSTRIVRDGEVVGLRGIIVDLSEHKAAEKALRESEEVLRQSQKMEAIGRLAGGIAHDFNNLLTTILGYAEMLLCGGTMSDESLESIREISRSAQRAASLTQQLLAYSRKQVLRPEELNINQLIANLTNMLGRLIHENIHLTTVLDPQIGRIKADPAQLEQVIINLAINARDSMPEGGKLTIETCDIMLDESYCTLHPEVKPGGYVMVAVTDTGCGIDKETQKQIFEPFFTTKVPGKGTGLGLATVFGTVKQSNGYVYAYSEPGLGSTFKIYLPVVQTRGPRGQRRAEARSGYRTDRRILLVEDDEAVRELVVRVLEKIGYTLVSASSGEEALGLLDRSEYGDIDLLISDVIMPGIGGKVLAERLQARIPALKVLYISGYPDETVVQHGVLDEGVAYLQKPFSPTAVIEKVRQILAED